jgi:hypothetical protein
VHVVRAPPQADFAVDSGIVDTVNPETLVRDVISTQHRRSGLGHEGAGMYHGSMASGHHDESSSSSSDDDDEDEDGNAGGGGDAAPAIQAAEPEAEAEPHGPPLAWVTHEDPYVRGLILAGLRRRPHWRTHCPLPAPDGGTRDPAAPAAETAAAAEAAAALNEGPAGWMLPTEPSSGGRALRSSRVRFHWGEYEEMDWEAVSVGDRCRAFQIPLDGVRG